jgi:hypothetical protein
MSHRKSYTLGAAGTAVLAVDCLTASTIGTVGVTVALIPAVVLWAWSVLTFDVRPAQLPDREVQSWNPGLVVSLADNGHHDPPTDDDKTATEDDRLDGQHFAEPLPSAAPYDPRARLQASRRRSESTGT